MKKSSWTELRPNLDLDERVVAEEILLLRLAVLREMVGISQKALSDKLGTSQPNVSQIERSEDMKVSTLLRYVHALGARLEINAVIDNQSLSLFDDEFDSSQLI